MNNLRETSIEASTAIAAVIDLLYKSPVDPYRNTIADLYRLCLEQGIAPMQVCTFPQWVKTIVPWEKCRE